MKKTVLMNAAKKARIALAVMAVCGMSFVGAQEAFAEIHISGNDNTYTDAKDFSTIVGNKNKLTGKDYDGEITKFTVLGSENSVNAFYEYVLSEDLAKKNQITVVGTKNDIKGTRNTVVGDNNKVYFNESIVLGQNNSLNPWGLNINSGKNILIGNDISAQTNDSNIAIGNKMTVTASWNTTVIGNESKSIGASEAVILGSNINAAYGRSVMVGNRTWAHGNSVALGYNAVAAVVGAEALGARSRAEKNFSVALGYGSLADEENTVSVGSNKERTITESNGTTTTIPERYRRIVNMADGKNNHDAATYGQIIKKDTYTISLDNTGNGNVVLKTNANNDGPTIKVDASALDTQIKKNASDITTVDGKIGTLTNLTTTEKGNLVAAVNEVKDSVDAAKTTADNAQTAAGAAQTKADSAWGLANTNKANIGSLSANGKHILKANNVSQNLIVLDEQVDKNKQAIDNITGNITNVDNKIGDLSADGHYILKSNKVAQNLSTLDTNLYNVDNRVGTFTPGSTYNYISAGNNVIDNLIALDKKVAENKVAIAGSAFDGTKLNDAIKNVDVAGGYKETTANANAETKGTIAGAINSAYQAGKDYTDTKVTAVEGKLNTLETKVDKNTSDISNIKTNIGDMSKLDVNRKNNLVDAVNEAYKAATSAGANVGKLDELTTTNKDNLVGAVNEVNKKADIAQTKADNALNKANTAQATATDALNKANNAQTTATDALNKANTNATNIGNLGELNTTNKGNLVGAVNEVNTKADKNAEDIKTVNGRVDELGGRVDTLGGAVSKLDTKVNKVGAGAAALAALHPMEFDSDNKLTFAAGVGSYHGASAAAIGAFYRPSEQVMFSISGNMGNGENMVNAGVSFALDRPSKTPTTKAALVKTVVAQNEQIAALNETLAEQNEKIARLEAMVEKLAAKQNA